MFESYNDSHFPLIKEILKDNFDQEIIKNVQNLLEKRNFLEVENLVGKRIFLSIFKILIEISQNIGFSNDDQKINQVSDQNSSLKEEEESVKTKKRKKKKKSKKNKNLDDISKKEQESRKNDSEKLSIMNEEQKKVNIDTKKDKFSIKKTNKIDLKEEKSPVDTEKDKISIKKSKKIDSKEKKLSVDSKKDKISIKKANKSELKEEKPAVDTIKNEISIKNTDFKQKEISFNDKLLKDSLYEEESGILKEKNENLTNLIKNLKIPEQKVEIKNETQELPINEYKNEILEKVAKNKITIISGDTGCGKTTQVPKFLMNHYNKIIIALPKRMAVISIANRVAEELNTEIGDLVGYKIRWDEKKSQKTKILFVTDGILSMECVKNEISKYDLIIIDEFHERKMDYEFILSYFLSKNLNKLILMSATIDFNKFKKLLNAEIIRIPVRKYKNTIYYLSKSNFSLEKEVSERISSICRESSKGDILVFLSGNKEIENVERHIRNTILTPFEIIKMSSMYSTKNQMQIFKKINKRKIILSTNISESSVTVNDLVYVIDTGQAKRINLRGYSSSLETMKISKSSAEQRAGRVGRVCPGHVFRIYTKNEYEILENDLEPEVVSGEITNLVLKYLLINLDFTACMKILGHKKIKNYRVAVKKLLRLECINDSGKITEIGKKISSIPLQIELSKSILKSIELNVFFEVAMICAFLDADRIFHDEKEKIDKIAKIIKNYSEDTGDHISFLNLFIFGKENNFNNFFCDINFIKIKSIINIKRTFHQILKIFNFNSFNISNLKSNSPQRNQKIAKSFCDGFRMNIAKRKSKNFYVLLDDEHHKLFIHRNSSICQKKPNFVLFNKLIYTDKFIMKDCMEIKPEMLLDCGYYQVNSNKN